MAILIDKEKIENLNFNSDNLEYKIGIATQTLERNIGFISNCDNKTSIVLTAIGVLLTIILTNDGLNEIFNIIKNCIRIKNFCDILYLICFLVSVLAMILGIWRLGSVLIAKTSEEANGVEGINSRIFFSGIRKNADYKTYLSKFYSMTKEELLDELIAQIYINADIATQKYNKFNSGFKYASIGFSGFVVIY